MDKAAVTQESNRDKLRHTVLVLNKIIDWGYKFFRNIGAALLLLIIVTITAGVISRYVFGRPFTWTEELGVFLLVWVSFIGACCAGAKNKHIAVDILTKKFPEKTGKTIEIIINVFILLFLVLVLISGILLQPQTFRLFSVILSIRRIYYYMPLIISAVYLIIITVRNILAILAGMNDYRYNNQFN